MGRDMYAYRMLPENITERLHASAGPIVNRFICDTILGVCNNGQYR